MFEGIFDGNGHTVRNMNVDAYVRCPSLFGSIHEGSVKNLNITDFEIVVPNYEVGNALFCVGALAGESWGVIENVSAKGTITGNGFTYDGMEIGGLVGRVGNTVRNCRADVIIDLENITSSSSQSYPFNVGGLAGVGFADITDCQTQGFTDFGECYDFLIVSDYPEEWDELVYSDGNRHNAAS